MILLPLWPKDALRFPTFTTTLLATNIVVFLITWPLQIHQTRRVGEDDVHRAAAQLVAVVSDAESGATGEIREQMNREAAIQPFPSTGLVEVFNQVQADESALRPPARYNWDLNYPLFESYLRTAAAKPLGTTPFKRWGFNPERDWWPGIVTHAFLHDGWLHLLFNLLFLWIAASIAEARLGIHVLWLYVSGGIAGALTQTQAGIPTGQILVGASGAIAGLMGFCLISEPKAKVKLLYVVFLSLVPKAGVFDSPLWFYLPIWLLLQFLLAMLQVGRGDVAVAHAAHIGGFVFGGLVGMVWRTFHRDIR